MADKLKIIIEGNSQAAQIALQKTNQALDKTKTKTAGMKGVLTNFKQNWKSIIAVVGGTVLALKSVMQATIRQEDMEKRLDAVLKSTKNAAGLTAGEIKKMAREMQNVTTFGDEAVLSGQNLLLTFKNIGRDVFPRATEVMLDVSEAMGQDMKTSAIQLGKALNDPITGLTALRRVGITFEESQEEAIKAMVEAGEIAKAQGAILEELESQFGGAARAAADTFGGSLKQMNNAIGDAKESIGQALIPVLLPLVKGITTVAKWFAKLPGPVKAASLAIVGGLMAAIVVAKLLNTTLMANPFILIGSIAAMAAIFIIANWRKIGKFFKQLWADIQYGAELMWVSMKLFAVTNAKAYIEIWNAMLTPFKMLVDNVIIAMNKIKGTNYETLSDMKSDLTENIDARIGEYARELTEIKRKNVEEVEDEKIKQDEKTMAEFKAIAEREKARDNERKSESKKRKKDLTQEEKDRQSMVKKLRGMDQSVYQTRMFYAQKGVDAIVDAAAEEKATLGSVAAALIKAEADAIAQKLKLRAAAAVALGQFVQAGMLTAAAVVVKATGSRVAQAIAGKRYQMGGVVDEPVIGVGQRTGQPYSFAEHGPEEFSPTTGRERDDEPEAGNQMTIENINIYEATKEKVMEALYEVADNMGMRRPLERGEQ